MSNYAPILHLVFYVLYVMVMILIAVLIVSKLIKSTRGAVVVGVLFVATSLFLLFKWMDAKSDVAYACRHLKVAVAMSSMYETQASPSDLGTVEPECAVPLPLDSCNDVVYGYNVLLNGPTPIRGQTCAARAETRFAERLTRAAGIASAEVLARDPQATNRSAARHALLQLLPGKRVEGLLYSDIAPHRRLMDDLMAVPAHDQQVNAYVLAGWHYQKKQYGKSLSRLKLALGDEWVKTGNVDEWWKQNLPLDHEQHLWIGYVLHKMGHPDRALQEFREAFGSDQTVDDMRGVYMFTPKLVM